MIYSNRDFTNNNLTSKTDMSHLTIENSCFSQGSPNTEVFPADMVGTTFIDCNLDNCLIPSGNTVIRCSQRLIEVQNDSEDWLMDPLTMEPTEPVAKDIYETFGLSIDPADLPAEPLDKSILVTASEE